MSDAARVLEGLRRQQQKYLEMAQVVGSQRAVYAKMDVDAILALIERKRSILQDVERLEAELAPLKADWARVRSQLSPGELRAVGELLDGTQRVLAELMRIEDEGRGYLRRTAQPAAPAVQDLIMKRRARNAYPAG